MKTAKCLTACRHCRFYTPEGRRGGLCEQLNVPVQGGWDACSLGIPPFAPPWEAIDEMLLWEQQRRALQKTHSRKEITCEEMTQVLQNENNRVISA